MTGRQRRDRTALRQRFQGRIAGVGSTSGVRVVVGSWSQSPLGSFGDVMVERPDGHRILVAPSASVREVIESTYVFDEVRIEPVDVEERDDSWVVTAPSLDLELRLGRRTALGLLLTLVPHRLASSTAWAQAIDPVASRLVRGVHTVGTARVGRREWYGATDLRAVTAISGHLDGRPLGVLAPVEPACRFGFSSTPRSPSVTTVVTTIELDAHDGPTRAG